MKIPRSQVALHVVSEAAAVAIGVPLLLATAARREPTQAQRRGLRAMALGTLLVDGWLITRWLRR